MARSLRFFALLIVPALAFACDRGDDAGRSQPGGQSSTAAAASRPLDERLLSSLDGRRQWPVNSAKVWLGNPTVATGLRSSGGRTVLVHAWGRDETDYNTAMMRVARGDVLYALTDAEFEELRARAAARKSP
jgi:hypothetical protein